MYSIKEGPFEPTFHSINDLLASSGTRMFFPILNGFFEGITMAAAGNCIAVMPNTGVIPTDLCTSAVLNCSQKYHLGLYVRENPPQDVQEFCEMAEAICDRDPLPPIIE